MDLNLLRYKVPSTIRVKVVRKAKGSIVPRSDNNAYILCSHKVGLSQLLLSKRQCSEPGVLTTFQVNQEGCSVAESKRGKGNLSPNSHFLFMLPAYDTSCDMATNITSEGR